MDLDENFTTSVELTKFLRQKGQDVHVVLQVAKQFFNGQINVYLPKSDLILVDWILDKLQTEKNWRITKESWEFLAILWKKLDLELADRAYASHRFGYIISETFNVLKTLPNLTSEFLSELLNCISECVFVINKAIFEHNVLSSFFQMCSWILTSHSDVLSTNGPEKLAEIFSKSVSYRSGVPINSYVLLLGNEKAPGIVRNLAQSVFLSHYNSIPQGSLHLFSKQDIKSFGKDFDDVVVNIFDIIASGFPSSNAQLAFSEFVRECPSATPRLLQKAAEHDLTFRDDILKPLIGKDLEILANLIKLNGNLMFSEDSTVNILDLAPEKVDQELADLTISYYASSRKLDAFLEIWRNFPSDSSWKSQASKSQLVTYLSRLSPYQHRQYVEKFESDDEIIFLLVECSSSNANIVVVLPLLTKIVTHTESWQLKYKILSLSREIADFSGSKILSGLDLNTEDQTVKYWMVQCAFRIYELQPASSVQEVVKETILHDPRMFLESISNRWFVLLGQTCDKDVFQKIAKAFTEDDTTLSWLDQLCSNWLFFEQQAFFMETLEVLVALTESESSCKKVLPIISRIPLAALPRAIRTRLLNQLTDKIDTISTLKLHEILRLVTIYSGRANIERDSMALYNLFMKSIKSNENAILAKEIVLAILKRKSSSKDDMSYDYIENLAEKSKKGKFHDAEEGHFELACLLSAYNRKAEKALSSFFSKSEKLNITDNSMLFLIELSSELILKYKGILASHIPYKRANLFFPLLCKLCTARDDILSLMAIYCRMDNHDVTIDSCFVNLLRDVPSEDFDDFLKQLTAGIGSSASHEALYRLCYLFGTCVNNTTHKSVGQQFTKLFCLTLQNVHVSSRITSSDLFWIVKLADHLVKDKSWTVSQFLLETILALVDRLVKFSEDCTSKLYVVCCDCISSIILFHRHRLNGRYHLIMQVFRSMLNYLSSKSCTIADIRCFSRLLGTLCEPPVKAIRELGGANNLSSAAALAKRQLSRYLPNFFLEYISVCLSPGLSAECKNELKSGIYAVMRVLDPDGLRRASGLMDFSSRAYLRPLYKEFLNNGKWQAANS